MATDHPVDISETTTTPVRGKPNTEKIDAGYKKVPFDFPAFMYVNRHVEPNDKALLGWSLDVELLARGKVTIKVSKNGPTDILVDGVRVHRIPKST